MTRIRLMCRKTKQPNNQWISYNYHTVLKLICCRFTRKYSWIENFKILILSNTVILLSVWLDWISVCLQMPYQQTIYEISNIECFFTEITKEKTAPPKNKQKQMSQKKTKTKKTQKKQKLKKDKKKTTTEKQKYNKRALIHKTSQYTLWFSFSSIRQSRGTTNLLVDLNPKQTKFLWMTGSCPSSWSSCLHATHITPTETSSSYKS